MSSGLWLIGFRVPKEKGSSDNISAFLRGGVLEHDTLMIDTCVLFSHRPIGWSVWAIRRLGGSPFDGVRGPDGGFGINVIILARRVLISLRFLFLYAELSDEC